VAQDENKARRIAAAGPIFADRGYEGATVRKICDAAGVNLASVNYYFGDKRKLYVETVQTAYRESTQQTSVPKLNTSSSAEDRLRYAVVSLVHQLVKTDNKPWQLRLMMREVIQPTEVGREIIQRAFRPIFQQFIEIVGELTPNDTPLHVKQLIVLSIVGQVIYHRNSRDVVTQLVSPEKAQEHFSVEKLAQHIFEFSLAAIQGMKVSQAKDGNSEPSLESRGSFSPPHTNVNSLTNPQ
jgi:AcrR family transcriptional regulator